MSKDTRSVVNFLHQRGIDKIDPYEVELQILKYYPNHIISVIEQVTPSPQSCDRANDAGWSYFAKPVGSFLSARPVANRLPLQFPDPIPDSVWVYNMVRISLLLADIAQAELQILLCDIPVIIRGSNESLGGAIRTCKARSARNVYYLRGVLTREASTIAGRVRELTQATNEAEMAAWAPPAGYEPLDSSERAIVALDWEAQQEEIRRNIWMNEYLGEN